MQGQVGRVRLAMPIASVKWSKWPWVTSITSQPSTAPGALGLSGFANHGSKSTVLPPGLRSSQHECPYQVIVVSAGSAMGSNLLGAAGGSSALTGCLPSHESSRDAAPNAP